MKTEVVSFLISTFNRREYLITALQSISMQSYDPIEIIIMDDGSSDGTEDAVAKFAEKNPRLSINFNTVSSHQGSPKNRRRGIEKISGKYVVFMDDDDYYTDELFIQKAINVFNSENSYAAVFFNSETLIESTQEVNSEYVFDTKGRVSSTDILNGFMSQYPKPQSTFPAMFSTQKLIGAGVLDMSILNDTQIYLRAFLGDDVYYDTSIVGRYRVHKGSIGYQISSSFIIENLIEKQKIAKRLPENIKAVDWLVKQSNITLEYYLKRVKRVDYVSLFHWLKTTPFEVQFRICIKTMIVRVRRFFLDDSGPLALKLMKWKAK